MKILSIESSCDETAAAVIEDGRKICSSVIHTQVEEHKLYGGVVPEIASRRHIESICGVTAEALEQAGLTAREVDAVAVTAAPGLIGAVLVGVNFAKGLALSAEKPLIPVHHIRGHVAANYLAHPELEPPFLALIVSGGHSHIVLVLDYCDYTILCRTTTGLAKWVPALEALKPIFTAANFATLSCMTLPIVFLIGLKLGRGFPQNRDAKKESSRALRELTERLEAQYGCTNCHELLGLDPSTPEGGALFAQNNLRETVCIPVMELCIRLLDTL